MGKAKIIDKTNATLLSHEIKTAKTGDAYTRVEVRFDKSGKISRFCLFDEQHANFQKILPAVEKNKNRCGVFFDGDFAKKEGKWIIWSGQKKEKEPTAE